MAEQKQIAKDPEIIKKIVVPLRRELLKVSRYRRTNKAMRAMKMLLQKQIKGSEVKLGNRLNEFLHQNGRKNPPQKVEVKMYKFKDKVIADILEAPFVKEEEKKKGLAEKVKGLMTGKKADVPEVEKEDMLQKTPVKQEPDMKPKQEVKTTKEEEEKTRKQDIIVKPQRPVHEKKK